jgi:multidrug efflux system outer membrane protein
MKFHKYLILLIIIFFGSCKNLQIPKERALLKMPTNFGATQQDSANMARVNWKVFFANPELISLIDTALQNNLDLLTAYQNIEIAKANLQFSKGLLKPTANAGLMAGLRKFGNYTMDGAGNATTDITAGQVVPVHLPDYFVGFQSNWEADIWGKLKGKKQAAFERYLASVEGRNWLVTNLVAEISNNYFELLFLDNELEILQQNIQLQEQSLILIKIQKEAGTSNELAVQQFEAQIFNSKAIAKELAQVIVEIENNINTLLGRYPQPINRNKANLYAAIQTIKAGVPSQLLQNRPDIRLAEQELKASRADVKAAKLAFYPSLNISASIGFQAFSPSFLVNTSSIAYSVLGGLTAPLINRSALKANFNTANAEQQKALFNYQKTVLVGFTEAYNQVKNIENLNEVYEIKQQEVSTIERGINSANLLFEAGKATYLEVLVTQQRFLQAKIDLLQFKKKQQQSTVNLYKALGGGWQ